MTTLNIILAVLICTCILALQIVIMGIARFFERTSGQKTNYRLYFIPLVFTAVAEFRYIQRVADTADPWPDFVGDPWANVLLFIAGLILIALSNALYEKMMGGRTYHGSR